MPSPAEHRSSGRAFRRPAVARRHRLLPLALAGALFLPAACAEKPAAPDPAGSADTARAGDPALVRAADVTGWQANHVTGEFVVQVELTNHNDVPVTVLAAEGPAYNGVDRKVVAVLAGRIGSGTPDLDTIRSAVTLPVTLNEDERATLTIAGHLGCDGPAAQPGEVPIVVDGRRTPIVMPPVEGDNWVAAMETILC